VEIESMRTPTALVNRLRFLILSIYNNMESMFTPYYPTATELIAICSKEVLYQSLRISRAIDPNVERIKLNLLGLVGSVCSTINHYVFGPKGCVKDLPEFNCFIFEQW